LHVFGLVAGLTQPEVHAASGSFHASPDAALGDGLTGDTGHGVNSARMERRVGVVDPGHFTSAGPIVGSRDVQAGTDEVFLDQFRRVAAGWLFERLRRGSPGADA